MITIINWVLLLITQQLTESNLQIVGHPMNVFSDDWLARVTLSLQDFYQVLSLRVQDVLTLRVPQNFEVFKYILNVLHINSSESRQLTNGKLSTVILKQDLEEALSPP